MSRFAPIAFDLVIILAPIALFIRDEFFSDKRTKKSKIVSRVVYVAIIISACASVFISRNNRIDTETFQKQVLQGLGERSQNTEDLKELLYLKYKEIFSTADKEAREWADDFVKTLSKKKANIGLLKEKSKELQMKYDLQWSPIREYILILLDKRIQELAKRNISIKEEKTEQDITVMDTSSVQTRYNIRTLTFPNGQHLVINLKPAYIQSGILVSTPQFKFYEGQQVFMIMLGEKSTEIYPTNPRYENFRAESKDPLKDEQFKSKLNGAIGQLVSNVYMQEAKK